jgi:hypothetical protein
MLGAGNECRARAARGAVESELGGTIPIAWIATGCHVRSGSVQIRVRNLVHVVTRRHERHICLTVALVIGR